VIRGYGPHLGAFFHWVAAEARRPENPRAIVYGADAMSPAERRLIETVLGVTVLSTEESADAMEAEASGKMKTVICRMGGS